MSVSKLKKKNILFIWIPRTGGTSIYYVFKKYFPPTFEKSNLNYIRKFNNQGFVTFGHYNIFDLISRNIISKDFFKTSFKFTFVRNPWDRLVSLYHQKLKTDQIFRQRYRTFSHFCKDIEKKINRRGNLFHEKLTKFWYQHKSILPIKYSPFFDKFFNRTLPNVGFYNVKGLNTANPQLDWITDDKGKLFVDFIGRYENLNDDFVKLSKIIGIEEKLPRLNVTNHKTYKLYYNEKIKKIVEQVYAKDIKFFNYQF